MKITTQNKKGCFIFHRWERKSNILDFTQYYECRKCGAREALQPNNSGYQPIDHEWLGFKKEQI